MAIDPKELTKIPETVASSKIKFVRILDEEQVLEFFQGLFRTSVEAKEEGSWEQLNHYLEDWEDKILNSMVMGKYAYETGPWALLTKPLSQCKVAIVPTGGVYVEGDEPFNTGGDCSFRILPKDTPHDKLRIAHTHYDLTGVLEDINTVYPVDTLKELEAEGYIGSLAETNYGFMGFIPEAEELIGNTAPEVARRLKADGVDAVLIPTT